MKLLCILFITCFSSELLGADSGRINGVIEKLSKGEPVFGNSPADFSLTNAAVLADSKMDFVQIDMEHTPLDFETLRIFLQGMLSRRETVENRSLRPNVVPFVSLPQNGRDQVQFMIKQALDLGAYGLMFAHINTPQEALAAVRASRYPQRLGALDFSPPGMRGVSPVIASRYWGLPFLDYIERVDAWPLDPKGELLLIVQIEEAEAVKNVDAILDVPGVGAAFIGPLDLATSMGFPGNPSAPEVQKACAAVLASCKKKRIACGIAASAENVERYVKEGYQMLIIGAEGEGISAEAYRALERVGRIEKGK